LGRSGNILLRDGIYPRIGTNKLDRGWRSGEKIHL